MGIIKKLIKTFGWSKILPIPRPMEVRHELLIRKTEEDQKSWRSGDVDVEKDDIDKNTRWVDKNANEKVPRYQKKLEKDTGDIDHDLTTAKKNIKQTS